MAALIKWIFMAMAILLAQERLVVPASTDY
jgi:hypothetical protein